MPPRRVSPTIGTSRTWPASPWAVPVWCSPKPRPWRTGEDAPMATLAFGVMSKSRTWPALPGLFPNRARNLASNWHTPGVRPVNGALGTAKRRWTPKTKACAEKLLGPPSRPAPWPMVRTGPYRRRCLWKTLPLSWPHSGSPPVGHWRLASRSSKSTPPTAFCTTSSIPPSPISAAMPMAAASKAAFALPSRSPKRSVRPGPRNFP